MTNPVLIIVIGVVVLLGPALILRMPADPKQWGHGPRNDIEPESGELPEILRRPLRPRLR